ncbi:GNAT family N-acetyltransferase [Candidatus Pacearchaeota archaeon]|nr:GNAT family N-acetyltransferase [Candidatus Pacearchaeota archaeon]
MKYSIEAYNSTDIDSITDEFIKEVDVYREDTPNFDHSQFSGMDESGQLQMAVMRDNGEFMGFHACIVIPDIFYRHIQTAFVLFYYVRPKARGKGYGRGLFEFAEERLKKKGVKRVFMSRKNHVNNSNLFKKLDYTHIEHNYSKAL